MAAPTVINRPAAPAGLDLERVALAAFALADAEHEAAIAGRELDLAEGIAIGERIGMREAVFASRIRAGLHLAHANELTREAAGRFGEGAAP